MARLLRIGLIAAIAVAACGGQSTGAPDAGTDASVADVATDTPPTGDAASHGDSAASDDANEEAPDAALCGGCAPGLLCCNVLMGGTYQCVDPKTDPLDCGGCNTMCSPGSQYCASGTCAVPPCSSTCTDGLCCGDTCCAHGRICCMADGGVQCVGAITCP